MSQPDIDRHHGHTQAPGEHDVLGVICLGPSELRGYLSGFEDQRGRVGRLDLDGLQPTEGGVDNVRGNIAAVLELTKRGRSLGPKKRRRVEFFAFQAR